MPLTRVRFDWAPVRNPNAFSGPREFARSLLDEFHSAQKDEFGAWMTFSCSVESVCRITELAYYASLLREEGRTPRLRIVFGADDAESVPYPILTRFCRPVAIADVPDLVKLAPALARPECALWVTERVGTTGVYWLECVGLLNAAADSQRMLIGFPDVLVTGSRTVLNKQTFLKLAIEGAGHLRGSFGLLWEYALRAGRITPTVLFAMTPPVQQIMLDCERTVRERCTRQYPDVPMADYTLQSAREITHLWTSILETAAGRHRGGAYILLPDASITLEEIRTRYNIHDGFVIDLDLGALLVEFSAACGRLFALKRSTAVAASPEDLERLAELHNDWLAKRNLLHSAIQAVAGLSEVDGCVLVDRGLRVHLFGGKIRHFPKGKTPRPPFELRDWYDKQQSLEPSIRKLGTRNQSACHFCREHPQVAAFVISQDTDLRVYCSDSEHAYAFEALAPC